MPWTLCEKVSQGQTLAEVAKANGVQPDESFYEVLTTESVSATKKVAVLQAGAGMDALVTKAADARLLAGLPLGTKSLVAPVQGARVWIQSKSSRRKLEAGGSVLFFVKGPLANGPSGPTSCGFGPKGRCRASGCSEGHAAHYCRNCKSHDSDHRASHCPAMQVSGTSTANANANAKPAKPATKQQPLKRKDPAPKAADVAADMAVRTTKGSPPPSKRAKRTVGAASGGGSSGKGTATKATAQGKPCASVTRLAWSLTDCGNLLYYVAGDPSAKIAAFDIDWTVIRTKSGKTFPTNDRTDWQVPYQ